MHSPLTTIVLLALLLDGCPKDDSPTDTDADSDADADTDADTAPASTPARLLRRRQAKVPETTVETVPSAFSSAHPATQVKNRGQAPPSWSRAAGCRLTLTFVQRIASALNLFTAAASTTGFLLRR